MSYIRSFYRKHPSMLLLICIFCLPANAQNFTTFTEWLVPTAASQPLLITGSGNNGAYFAEQFGGKIGFIDTNKNVITEWTLRAGSQPTGAAVQGQKVTFAEEDGHIAVLDVNGNTLTEWEVPLIQTFRLPLGVATHGKLIFFSDFLQGAIGMLNLSTNQMTLWLMPGAPFRRPNQLVTTGPTSDLRVWVADSVGRISMLHPATNTFTEWPAIPINVQPVLQNLAIAADGTVVFNDFHNFTVGVLDPAANFIREWSVPTANSYPVNVAVLARGTIAFAGQFGNQIGTLDLGTAPDFAATVTPTVTTVAPTVQVVTPTIMSVVKTNTPVTPTITAATAFITGGFVEYPIPTPSSGPVGLSVNSKGAILFTESSAVGNRIGLLQ